MAEAKTKRRANDAYFTPEAVVRACVSRLPPDAFWLGVWEPACGGGTFALQLGVDEGYGIVRVPLCTDLVVYPGHPKPNRLLDFTDTEARNQVARENGTFSLVCTNPPFSLAVEFILGALEVLVEGGYAAFLLRTDFAGSDTRYKRLFRDFPPWQEHQLVTRPCFEAPFGWEDGKKNTDQYYYSFFIWKKGHTGLTEKYWLDWREWR